MGWGFQVFNVQFSAGKDFLATVETETGTMGDWKDRVAKPPSGGTITKGELAPIDDGGCRPEEGGQGLLAIYGKAF
jgi:hypothetical protein